MPNADYLRPSGLTGTLCALGAVGLQAVLTRPYGWLRSLEGGGRWVLNWESLCIYPARFTMI